MKHKRVKIDWRDMTRRCSSFLRAKGEMRSDGTSTAERRKRNEDEKKRLALA
jgi:hypothetical protein